jgi:hypothetical protein
MEIETRSFQMQMNLKESWAVRVGPGVAGRARDPTMTPVAGAGARNLKAAAPGPSGTVGLSLTHSLTHSLSLTPPSLSLSPSPSLSPSVLTGAGDRRLQRVEAETPGGNGRFRPAVQGLTILYNYAYNYTCSHTCNCTSDYPSNTKGCRGPAAQGLAVLHEEAYCNCSIPIII